MEFTCLQEKLSAALQTIEKVVGKNISLPILQNVLIETEKGRIKMSATDLEVGVMHWITAKIKNQGSITVPARVLTGFIGAIPEKQVTLKSDKHVLRVSSGKRYRASINGMDPSEFPIIPKVKEKFSFRVEAKRLKDGLSQVGTASAISETRPEIAGVHLIAQTKNELVLVATDSYRLAEKALHKVGLAKPGFTFTIPLRAVQELLRILPDSSTEITAVIDESQITFQTDNLQLVSRLTEGNFPDYKKIVPTKFTTQLVVARDPFIEAVRVASFFSTKLSDVQLSINPPKELEIAARNQNVGGSNTLLSAEVEGKRLTFTFNHHYLMDGLRHFSRANILMQFNNPDQPALIKGVGDASYYYLVMPIKTPAT